MLLNVAMFREVVEQSTELCDWRNFAVTGISKHLIRLRQCAVGSRRPIVKYARWAQVHLTFPQMNLPLITGSEVEVLLRLVNIEGM